MTRIDIFKFYLHLNASFSDNIGIVNGKSAVALFFSSIDDHYYRHEITFVLLEEIISQVDLHTPYSFGHGLAGIGCLLEYVRGQNTFDIDVNILVENFEPLLLKSIRAGRPLDITLENGLSGYGIYILSRYNSGVLSEETATLIRECIAIITNQVLDAAITSNALLGDPSLWTGISGIYLFLSHASSAGFVTQEHEESIGKLFSHIIQTMTNSKPDWHQAPLWFVLLNGRSLLAKSGYAENIHSLFDVYLGWCSRSTNAVYFADAAFYAGLFHYTYLFQDIAKCLPVSEKLVEMANRVLATKSLKVLFPYNPDTRRIQMGLFQGVSGTAMALRSIENNDFGWMEILGYKNHCHTN